MKKIRVTTTKISDGRLINTEDAEPRTVRQSVIQLLAEPGVNAIVIDYKMSRKRYEVVNVDPA